MRTSASCVGYGLYLQELWRGLLMRINCIWAYEEDDEVWCEQIAMGSIPYTKNGCCCFLSLFREIAEFF